MAVYILRRVALVPLMVLGITLMTFIVSHMLPASPESAMLSLSALSHPEIVSAFREKWGLDKSLPDQYLFYLRNLVRGDFGTSRTSNRPVTQDIKQYWPATIELATSGLLLSITIGLPLGVYAAVDRGGRLDSAIRVFSLLGASVPIFWLALITILVFYHRLGWAPGIGRFDPRSAMPPTVTGFYTIDSLFARDLGMFWTSLTHLVLPSSVLAIFQTAYIVRITRSGMLEVLTQDYIRTARAKGLRERTVLYRHALLNALLPLISYLGLAYGMMLAGTVVIETVFAWPGLGRYAFFGTSRLDFAAIMGVTTVLAIVYVLVNLVVDVLQAAIDPRIRLGG